MQFGLDSSSDLDDRWVKPFCSSPKHNNKIQMHDRILIYFHMHQQYSKF